MLDASSKIVSKEQAIEVAKQFIARRDERAKLIASLKADDMLGLECAETVKLERLTAQDAVAGILLADWILTFGGV